MAALRGVIAVILGYAVFALSAVLLFKIAGREPHAPQNLGFIVFAVVYGMVFAGVGGLVAARMAPKAGNRPAAFVSCLIAIGAIASLIGSPGAQSTWSQWTAIVLMAPCAWMTSRMSARRPVQ